jgi:hypothetical protein
MEIEIGMRGGTQLAVHTVSIHRQYLMEVAKLIKKSLVDK